MLRKCDAEIPCFIPFYIIPRSRFWPPSSSVTAPRKSSMHTLCTDTGTSTVSTIHTHTQAQAQAQTQTLMIPRSLHTQTLIRPTHTPTQAQAQTKTQTLMTPHKPCHIPPYKPSIGKGWDSVAPNNNTRKEKVLNKDENRHRLSTSKVRGACNSSPSSSSCSNPRASSTSLPPVSRPTFS
jgi:hypothetical protein